MSFDVIIVVVFFGGSSESEKEQREEERMEDLGLCFGVIGVFLRLFFLLPWFRGMREGSSFGDVYILFFVLWTDLGRKLNAKNESNERKNNMGVQLLYSWKEHFTSPV